MCPNPMTRTPVRRKNRKHVEHTEGMPCKGRGRDWSDMPTNQETPR